MDFRIYGKELTATEVSELYTGRVEVYNKNNIGIGTSSPNNNYILDVNGNFNSSSLYNNGTLIDFNSYATKTENNLITSNSSNYTSNISNILLNIIPTNVYSNLNIYSEKLHPPKLYNSFTIQTLLASYLGQSSVYKETFTLDSSNITYGIGT